MEFSSPFPGPERMFDLYQSFANFQIRLYGTASPALTRYFMNSQYRLEFDLIASLDLMISWISHNVFNNDAKLY